MTKYTPGPWEVSPGEFVMRIKSIHSSEMVACVTWLPREGRRSSEEAKANARLLAAAPELLEALKELLDNQNGPPLTLDRHRKAWAQAVEKSCAAIAKAET